MSISNLLEISHLNVIFIARGNVKHSFGGPVMALIGFIHPIALGIFNHINDSLTAEQNRFLAEKIILSDGKKIGFYSTASSNTFYGHIFNVNNKLENWYYPGTYASSFHCLVRFYDTTAGKFVYKVFTPLEMELV